jgi:hypothetical protein
VQVVAIGEGEKMLRSLFLAERFWPLAGSDGAGAPDPGSLAQESSETPR